MGLLSTEGDVSYIRTPDWPDEKVDSATSSKAGNTKIVRHAGLAASIGIVLVILKPTAD